MKSTCILEILVNVSFVTAGRVPQQKIDQEELGIVDHTLPYTQEELSVCLNLHRTTVARILAGFAKKGLVRLGYRKIQVTDMIGLRNELR